MNRAVGAAIAVALVSLGSLPASAQSPPTVTEAEFLSALTEDHPALVELREAVAFAKAAVRQAGVLANPQFDAIREAPSEVTEQTDLVLAWQLPALSRGPAIAAEKRSLMAAESRFETDRLALRSSMRQAYETWALAFEFAARLGDHARQVGELAVRQERRASSGEASGVEAARLALAVAELHSQLALLDSQVLEAAAVARGWDPSMSPESHPVLPVLPPLPSSPGAESPALHALREEVEAARLSRKADGRYVELPEIIAGWQDVEVGAESFGGPVVGLSWRIPLADRNQAARRLSDAQLESANARLEVGARRIGAEREGALAAFGRLRVATTEARSANRSNSQIVTATMAAFQAGEASLTDVLETVRSVLSAESTTLRLHAAALEAHRRLEQLVGRPLDLE